ncbi:hypothetical protein D9M68_739780 [compost metagenome]
MLGQFGQPGFLGHSGQAAFRAAIAVALIVGDQPFAYCRIGGQLQVTRHGGGDIEAFGIGVAAVAPNHFRACHFCHIGGGNFRCGYVVAGIDRFSQRRFVALLVDAPKHVHAPENPVAALLGAGWVNQGVEA